MARRTFLLATLLATAGARSIPLAPASSLLAPTPLKDAQRHLGKGALAGAVAPGGETAGTMSDTAAVVSLFKTIVGGGILALPAGMAAGRGTGVWPGLGILALHASVSAYTYALVGRSVAKTGARSFNELWARAFGEESAWIIDAIVVGVAGGACLTYACFLGDLLSQLVPSLGRTEAILALAVVPMAPLVLLRDLSALSSASFAGLAAVAVSAFVVCKRALDGSYAPGGAFGGWLGGGAAATPLDQISGARVSVGTTVLFNMLSTAFMCHTNAVRAYHELAAKERQAAVAAKAFGLAALVHAAVQLAGYYTFGAACQGLILSNYAASDPLALVTRVATAVSLLSSHPLLFTSFRDAAFSLFSSGVDPLLAGPAGDRNWKLLTLGLLAVPTAAAIVLPDVGFVVSLMGASLGAALILVIPSLFGSRLLGDADASPAEKAAMKGVTAFGVAIGVFGTVITVLETYTDLLK